MLKLPKSRCPAQLMARTADKHLGVRGHQLDGLIKTDRGLSAKTYLKISDF